MRILLTNDDGIEAPGLVPFARALQTIGDLEVVVPDRERSWVAKATTRFDRVTVTRREVHGLQVHACSGFPADCAQLGINALFDDPPDIVVSGINVGYNHGAAFLQSSGTAGAALEASISGVAAIALSTGSADIPWREWKRWVTGGEARPVWERLADIAAGLVAETAPLLRPREVINIGIPDGAESSTARRLTRVADVEYDRRFEEVEPGVFVHAYVGLVHDRAGLEGSDVEAAVDDVISVTPIRGAGDGPINEALAAALGLS